MALVEIDTRVIDGMEVQIFENEGWRRARRASDRRSTFWVSSGIMLGGCEDRRISGPDATEEIEAYVRQCIPVVAAFRVKQEAEEHQRRLAAS